MKKIILLMLITFGLLQAQSTCTVQICNKLERFSFSPWSHIKDRMGETCWDSIVPKKDAIVGKKLDSSSRWYQGSSINPTKRSVTKIKRVYSCS